MSIEEFKKIDESFSESMFITKINNIFVKLFTNITMDNLREIDHFIGDNVYNYASDIILEAKKKNARKMYDELNVNSSIRDIRVKENVYEIEVLLIAKYMDYLISLEDGSFVSGNDKSRIQNSYIAVFEKEKDANDQSALKKCPSCGNYISINKTGFCSYCKKVFAQEGYDWVLTDIKKI